LAHEWFQDHNRIATASPPRADGVSNTLTSISGLPQTAYSRRTAAEFTGSTEQGASECPAAGPQIETIHERAEQEPQFRKALLREAVELMLSGDEKTGRAILRNYIATVGRRQLAGATSIPANSLMRMFGPNDNPSAKNLFGVLAHL